MIFFGTKGVKSTLKSGEFNCPQCNNTQNYKHIKVKKFFTLYFIPIIPLDSLGEYVECRNCKGTFVPNVLDKESQNNEFMAHYEYAMRHSMVRMMLADGKIDENEKKIVLEMINKFGDNDLSEIQLDELIIDIKKDNKETTHYLKSIAPSLNEHGKETIIKCALHIACSDGDFDESEEQMLIKMAEALEMSSSHLKGIFSEMFESESIEK